MGIGDSSGSGMRVDGIGSSNTRINVVLAEGISGVVVVVGSVVSSIIVGGGSHHRLTGGSAHMHLLTIAHASLIPAIAVPISVPRIAISVSSICVATIPSISVARSVSMSA